MKYKHIEFESKENEKYQLMIKGKYSFFMLMTEDNFIKFKDGAKFKYFDSSRLYFSPPYSGKWSIVVVPKDELEMPNIWLERICDVKTN